MARLNVRARAVDLLGRQQVAGIPTAISELFKNAHDAYANKVAVDFFRVPRLFLLRDDGVGMSRTDFESRWLTIGTESKVGSASMAPPPRDETQPIRPVMGEKGIGRLAIALIGPQVLVITRAKDAEVDETTLAFINWAVFVRVTRTSMFLKIPQWWGYALASAAALLWMLVCLRTAWDRARAAFTPPRRSA